MFQTILGLIGAVGLVTFFVIEALSLTKRVRSMRTPTPDPRADVNLLLAESVNIRPHGDPTAPDWGYGGTNEARERIIEGRHR